MKRITIELDRKTAEFVLIQLQRYKLEVEAKLAVYNERISKLKAALDAANASKPNLP